MKGSFICKVKFATWESFLGTALHLISRAVGQISSGDEAVWMGCRKVKLGHFARCGMENESDG